MDVEHTDSDEAKAADLRETRRRFLLARERASVLAEQYRAASRPMPTESDLLTL
jgi:hypothetical protein